MITPEECSRLHRSIVFQLPTYPSYYFHCFCTSYISGEEDVEVHKEGFLETIVKVLDFLCGSLPSFDLFVSSVIAFALRVSMASIYVAVRSAYYNALY